VQLIVTDGGKPYLLNNPFKLTAAGWVSNGSRISPTGREDDVTPLPAAPRSCRNCWALE
jgi:hypothetical protein